MKYMFAFRMIHFDILGRYNAGQNLAAYNVWNWTHIIDYWHDEVYNFVFGVGSEDGGSVGHYTQVSTCTDVAWYKQYWTEARYGLLPSRGAEGGGEAGVS